MWNKLNPAVPRRWLFAIAGIAWTAVGLLLCARSVIWLNAFPLGVELSLESIGVVAALVVYFYGLSKIVQKNMDRITALPDRACIFAFTAWKGYFMIALMVTVGITLRSSFIPKYYLSVPYTGMGGALLLGSVRFYSRFFGTDIWRKG